MKSLRNKIIGTVLACLTTFSPLSLHGGGSIENRVDRENIGLDIKLYGPVVNHISYFARHIQNTDYNRNANQFTLFDLIYTFNKVDITIENQFYESKTNTKIGIGFNVSTNPVNIYSAFLADLNKKSHELNTFLNYRENNLEVSSEVYFNFNNHLDINSIMGRINLGVDVNDNFSVGIFGQGNIDSGKIVNPAAGLFFKIKS